jgi:rod shape-determining protein MreC
MPRSLERPEARRDTWLFATCLGLATLALFLPQRWGQRIASALRETALVPVVWLQDRGAEGRTSRARFRAVVAQRDSMSDLARVVPDLVAENARLRQALGLAERLGPGFLPAEVLRQTSPTDGRTLLIDRGRAHGVAAFAPVVSPEGLVGVVREVDERTSIVMTWAHPEFRVSAVSANGIVSGIAAPTAAGDAGRTALEFRAITYRDTLPDGTLVFASGLGGVYPRGVPIGLVAGVEREQAGWERVYRLRPLAQPGALGHVLVLQGDTPLRVPQGFAELMRQRQDSARPVAPPILPTAGVAESTAASPAAAPVPPPVDSARRRRARRVADSAVAPAPVAPTPAEPAPAEGAPAGPGETPPQ